MDEQIYNLIKNLGYDREIGDVICRMLHYMEKKKWIGACYSTAAILYVCLSELGYKCKLCLGEVITNYPTNMVFDHGWIEVDDKIIDLACYRTLMGGVPVSGPIIFDIDVLKNTQYSLLYGFVGKGIDREATMIYESKFSDYMSNYPFEKDGLWAIVKYVLNLHGSTKRLKEKYCDIKWNYIINE